MHPHENRFLHKRCVDCPSEAPSCNCGVGQQCIITSRSCDACPSASCVSSSSAGSSNKSSGVSGGAIAGAVIGVLLLLGASVGLLFWYRRRQRGEKATAQPAVDPKPDVPARAEAVLSRPDPVEKPPGSLHEGSGHEPESVRMYSVMSDSTINLDPQAFHKSRGPSNRGSVQSNPFTDTHSIQTTSASTQSTNVIPIALVPHGSVSTSPHSPAVSDDRSGISSVPARPGRSPDVGLRFDPLSSSLNLEHVNVSKDSFRPPNAQYAQSQASGISEFSSRDSVMTSGSFASDVLYEIPQIVTNAGRVNLLKAEVVSVHGSGNRGNAPGTPMMSSQQQQQGLKAASRASKPPSRSPLAQSSFGPADALSVGESDEGQEVEYHPQRNNPFGDEHSPRLHTVNTTSTFGGTTPIPIPSTASPVDQYQPRGDEEGADKTDAFARDARDRERPVSTLTQATSIIGAEIGGATVVRLNSTGSSSHRLTSARLVNTPTSGPIRSQDDRTLQQQQAQALAAARARAAASGLPMPGMRSNSSLHRSMGSTASSGSGVSPLHSRRVSEASVMSAGADSLLESFTFVPPSPISSRPPRSPSSPLQQQAMAQATATAGVPPVPPLPKQVQEQQQQEREKKREREEEKEKEKKAMRTGTGMTMGKRQVSVMSSASTGIEGYDFRIESSSESGVSVGDEQTQASVASTFGVTSPTLPNSNSSSNTSKPPPSAATNAGLKSDGSLTSAGAKGGGVGRQRASLDTLALTADLSAFPLNFDEGRGSFGVPTK